MPPRTVPCPGQDGREGAAAVFSDTITTDQEDGVLFPPLSRAQKHPRQQRTATDRTHVPLPDPAQPDAVHRMFFNWEHTDGALQLGQVYGAPTTNPMPVTDIQSPVWSAPPSMRRQAEGGQPSATRGRACSHPGKIANVQSAHSTKDILHLPLWSPPIRAVRRPLHRWGN